MHGSSKLILFKYSFFSSVIIKFSVSVIICIHFVILGHQLGPESHAGRYSDWIGAYLIGTTTLLWKTISLCKFSLEKLLHSSLLYCTRQQTNTITLKGKQGHFSSKEYILAFIFKRLCVFAVWIFTSFGTTSEMSPSLNGSGNAAFRTSKSLA